MRLGLSFVFAMRKAVVLQVEIFEISFEFLGYWMEKTWFGGNAYG